MPLDPEVSCTYESTTADPPEAVKVVWVTGHDDPDEQLIMVGHEGGVAGLTRAQWDEWCDRVGARMWEEDAKRLAAWRAGTAS